MMRETGFDCGEFARVGNALKHKYSTVASGWGVGFESLSRLFLAPTDLINSLFMFVGICFDLPRPGDNSECVPHMCV